MTLLFGNPEASKEFRSIMGLDSTYKRCTSLRTYQAVLDETLEQLKKVADTTQYAPLEKFANILIEFGEKGFLPTHAELGYFNSRNDFGYSYIGVLIPYEYVETVREYATDEDFITYICDASSEREMWAKDKENPEVAFTKEHRKGTNITCDIENEYVNIMFLRYPSDCFSELEPNERENLFNNYIWVQIKPVVFGEKSLAISAYAEGLLNELTAGTSTTQ